MVTVAFTLNLRRYMECVASGGALACGEAASGDERLSGVLSRKALCAKPKRRRCRRTPQRQPAQVRACTLLDAAFDDDQRARVQW